VVSKLTSIMIRKFK